MIQFFKMIQQMVKVHIPEKIYHNKKIYIDTFSDDSDSDLDPESSSGTELIYLFDHQPATNSFDGLKS